jgi:hypothetical protein
MNADPSRPDTKLEVDTETVEALVDLVRRGEVRVPSFQRGMRWKEEDVLALFDSVYRGYPIGSILLHKGAAEAARIQIGPLTIDGPETHQALWVVDGQQRLTALAAGLSRPRPVPRTPDDPWVVYFDAETQSFRAPPQTGDVPSTWVPVAEMLDASVLGEWVSTWEHRTDAGLRMALFQAGARIRQYQIAVYTVETEDEKTLRDIFYRINKFGQSLRWDEVRDALAGRKSSHPSTLQELAAELQKLGMGCPEEQQLLACVMACKGLGAVQDALPALRGALSFLRRQAEIPHLRLLPRSTPLVVLTRFFALYPDPKARTLRLLTRWTWRVLLGAGLRDERTLLRHGVSAIEEGDEEGSVQALLALVPRERRDSFKLPPRFDARAAGSRLALLGLSSLRPRDLRSAALIDVADVKAFRRILPPEDRLGNSPANRMLASGFGAARKELLELLGSRGFDEVLESHAITPAAAAALVERDAEGFLRERRSRIEEAVNLLGERLAAWSRSDRPSISYLLRQVEARP